jgi:hypothetical protein
MEVDKESQEADGPITRSDLFHLSHKEQELFNFLMQIVKEFDLKVVLRVAGGWVRDKVRLQNFCFSKISLIIFWASRLANVPTLLADSYFFNRLCFLNRTTLILRSIQ